MRRDAARSVRLRTLRVVLLQRLRGGLHCHLHPRSVGASVVHPRFEEVLDGADEPVGHRRRASLLRGAVHDGGAVGRRSAGHVRDSRASTGARASTAESVQSERRYLRGDDVQIASAAEHAPRARRHRARRVRVAHLSHRTRAVERGHDVLGAADRVRLRRSRRRGGWGTESRVGTDVFRRVRRRVRTRERRDGRTLRRVHVPIPVRAGRRLRHRLRAVAVRQHRRVFLVELGDDVDGGVRRRDAADSVWQSVWHAGDVSRHPRHRAAGDGHRRELLLRV